LRQEHQVIVVEKRAIDEVAQQRKMGRPGGEKARGESSLEQAYEPDGSGHSLVSWGPMWVKSMNTALLPASSLVVDGDSARLTQTGNRRRMACGDLSVDAVGSLGSGVRL
jgi:hypothetical protein